ncbi:elongation of very long chain fatty acids protein 7-like [Oppia nitens]|uniref:elongation of very long chain fatty acids protein 7-like n=1 Tax=Oppia nitens TaxID=1686743 RepID=UPI0023DC2C3B|nr:elongation of very long chain fatty acids protein 7-like [Oppia nitens]
MLRNISNYSSIAPVNQTTGAYYIKTNRLSYYLLDFWDDIGDPRTRHLPLLTNGPWTLCAIMLSYLIFTRHIGPALMKHRDPYTLRHTMLLYNTVLVVCNVYFFIEALVCIGFGRDLLDFQFPSKYDTSPRAMRMLYSGYAYFLTKFLDLFDTVFFVLRKKYSQITILHLYHHTIVPMLGWMAMKISPTAAPIGLFAIANSFVHTVMYTYYALSALGPSVRPYLWWKKYLTILQLCQFVIYGVYYTVFLFAQSGYPAIYMSIGFIQPFIFFYMFWQFFHYSYNGRGNNNKHNSTGSKKQS